MKKKLAIVESPTKSKTIKSFLGPDWIVASSFGHIKDLPKSKLGVDIKNNFEPQFTIPPKAKKHVQFLKEQLKKADSVWLSTDEDREGEAIAQHIVEVLKLKEAGIPFKRIVFHEITKSAIQQALKNPRDIEINLVNAQKARRVLDRLVGYKLSPLLWKKISYGLSAGRVQSVALRLVAEREKEIKKFKSQEYWSIEALFSPQRDKEQFQASLQELQGKKLKKFDIKTAKQAGKIANQAKKKDYKVLDFQTSLKSRQALPPFTTATLQQEAGGRFGFSTKKTMVLAQQLYEGLPLGKLGRTGLITYHRTDSVRLAPKALSQAKQIIPKKFGKDYLQIRQYKSKGRTQEAHEAIRPAELTREPESLKTYLNQDQLKLYDLIYRRTLASQMSPALFEARRIDIADNNKELVFRATGQVLKFEGFLKVYPVRLESKLLPELKKHDPLKLHKILPSQHFTEPPPRYTEATLVKALKDNGVGRPSTYAPTIEVIQRRRYVEKRERARLYLTDLGEAVNNLLVQHFPKIVDIEFTAHMEDDLDTIAEGRKKWQPVIAAFYEPFEKQIIQKEKEISKKDLAKKTDKICPQCGAPVVIKFGRFGQFFSCSKFPECKHAEPILDKIGLKCPQCQKGEIIRRRTKKGRIFFGCSQFPNCKFALWDEPVDQTCPDCGGILVKKGPSKLACSNKQCAFTKALRGRTSQNFDKASKPTL